VACGLSLVVSAHYPSCDVSAKIALGTAALVNNWSDKRQYPTYWGLPILENLIDRFKIKDAATVEQ
jgi:hypothetical protein